MTGIWWTSYEQYSVLLALVAALVTVVTAFKGSSLQLKSPFVITLTWDFSRSWATNISGIAGVIGVLVVGSLEADIKTFADAATKSSYTVTAVLMAAMVVAAPSVFVLLQIEKDDQLTGCVGGFLAASVLTIWGTIAQLLLQMALLLAFICQKIGARFSLFLVAAVLACGLILLFPYSVRSIRAALAAEAQKNTIAPVAVPRHDNGLDKFELPIATAEIVAVAPVPRKVALL